MDNSLKMKDGLITCKACGRKFGYILRHLSQDPECKNTYSHSEYEILQNESRSITYKNNLILKRSRYNKEKRGKQNKMQKMGEKWICHQEKMAKKYQIQRKDKSWMKKRALKKRERYHNQARAEEHESVRDEKHKEIMENRIKSEEKVICQKNESCKKEVTKCLLSQVKNLKATKLSRETRKEIRDIKLEIDKVHKDVDEKVETACATSEDHYKSSLLLRYKLVNISAWFWQVKCTETWAEFRRDKLARQMSIYEYENKYTCPSCQERICRQ